MHPDTSAITKKEKHTSLLIADKISLLKAHDQGISINSLCETCCIENSTVYDISKQKENVLKFFSGSDSLAFMKKKKSIKHC